MRLAAWVSLALREARGSAGRLGFFTACLAVGVAAVVAVAGLSSAIDRGIQGQARELLAADLAIESRRPIAPEVVAAVDALGLRRVQVAELPSMVSLATVGETGGDRAGTSLLVELKAVGLGYPFYGRVATEPDRPLSELLDDRSVLVGPELLTRLGAEVGGRLRIGEAAFAIAGLVTAEPDRLRVSFTLGPRVMLSAEGLARTGLTGRGSRVEHRLLAVLAPGATAAEVERAATAIRAALPDPAVARVETYAEAQPNLRRGLDRVAQFLGLVALLSLLVGGIGVAQAVRAWLSGRLDEIAVLRALGITPGEVLGLYLAQTVVLALVGSAVGALAGWLLSSWMPVLLGSLLPVRVEVGWQPAALLRGVGLGVGVAVVFALRPLAGVVRVPPVRVLRRDAEPLPERRGLAVVLSVVLVGGVAAVAAIQASSVVRGLQFAGGLAVATLALVTGARLMMAAVGRSARDGWSLTLRHGLAALARPGAGTLGAVVALGLGVTTVLGMFLLQDRLTAQLDADLPDDAPTAFLVDVQPDQWPGVREALEEAGAERLDSVEVVMARLRAVAGVPVTELVGRLDRDREGSGDRRWVLTREQRLTSMAELPEDNVIVAGALWSDPGRAEVSVEADFARDLGVDVGDTLELDVQGLPLELTVTSLRTVDWGRFSINFFLVVEPGVLDGAPAFRIAAARLPEAAELPLQDRLAAAYPNITVLRLRQVLDTVVAVLENVGIGVRVLGGFTVLAGIAILAGAVSAGAARRGREAALLKTLGMTRAQVATVFAVEYSLVGLVAGLIGTVGGVVLAWSVTRFGFEIPWAWSPAALAAAVVLTAVLSVAAGLAASARALAVRPVVALRRTG